MYSVSKKFIEVVNSNIRPAVKPIIKARRLTAMGQFVEITWTPKEIVNFTYKREIDPLGRTLPYMELTWTERYKGKFVDELFEDKTQKVTKFMEVELSIEQGLSFFNTWKGIYEQNKTWKDVFSDYKTWKSVKNDAVSETVTFPKMFLVEKPTIKGQEITWRARDLFYFLEKKQGKSFEKSIRFENPLRWFLLEERANFGNSVHILQYLDNTQKNLLTYEPTNNYSMFYEGSTKNLLMNYASTRNYYWDFSSDKAEMKKLEELLSKTNVVYEFPSRILKEKPQTTVCSDVSAYSFKQYVTKVDTSEQYELKPEKQVNIGSQTYNYFVFKGLGKPVSNQGATLDLIAKDTFSDVDTITVSLVVTNSINSTLKNKASGEEYTEDNKCNPYPKEGSYVIKRLELIDKYFNSSVKSTEISTLSNIALETGDLVSYPTNDYTVVLLPEDPTVIPPVLKPTVKNIVRKALVVGIELTYNGTIKQKTRLHEVTESD